MNSVLNSAKRLLPGDAAPPLMLSRNLVTGELSPRVEFNGTSMVVLWNSGCSGCLPALVEYSKKAKALGVPTYGVAIMERDLGRTIETARQVRLDAFLAHEQIDPEQAGLPRGQVTREWLEASGQRGVPTAFLVDWQSKIVWLGPLDDAILEPLHAILDDVWDVDAARRRWETEISDNDITHLAINRDIVDAMLTKDMKRAQGLIDEAERNRPEIADNKEFAVEKLIVLSAMPETAIDAGRYYNRCVRRFADDPLQILSLTDYVLVGKAPLDVFLDAASEALSQVERQLDGMPDDLVPSIRFNLTSAQLRRRLGDQDGYQQRLDALRDLATSQTTPSELKKLIKADIERLARDR
ncbi:MULTISPECIES: hypothetical protein [unclassified Shinella]|uniref:TlpA family protein disulfide reductase n=1 Tax=unclassified Shinella TaxID=2643062 RepID=UPI00225D3B1D|nr:MULTISPECIES: hypothetical protein [unclassified Shinella]MCO5140158.1 hypothetical protein [Shinella sp.]MDC7256824.1 hypothetical protein [Shinella sp. YE25]CAI0339708.1 putative Thioredoxin domain-containing protein [Rhizobiaceae bacterium]CAK7258100.1 putative Thioredoxin domain-containing protein [Shinella sp. WSC3-e]